MSGDPEARIAAYTAWIEKLEATHAGYLGRRVIYQRFFVALSLAGLGCFAFGFLPGVWGTFSAGLISVAGWAMYKTRLWEIESEIAQNRREIDRMREHA